MTGNRFSHAEDRIRALARILIVLFLVSPYLIWLAEIPEWSEPAFADWWVPLSSACLQAMLSSVGAMLVGVLLFQGFQAWSYTAVAEGLLLLPNMVPPIFLVMSLLSLITPWWSFPQSLAAVVFAHVLMNAGLVAISLDRILRLRLAAMADAAWVMGCSRLVFWRRVVWPMAKVDMATLFLFVFSICLTSFSIPLLLSDSRSVTLEVSIYDAIRSEGRWDKAVIFAALQTLFLLGLAWLMPRAFWPIRTQRFSLKFLAGPWLRPLVLVPTLLLSVGWCMGLIAGWSEGLENFVVEALPDASLGSCALGLAVGLVHLMLFLMVSYVLPHARLTRFLNGYMAPSSAITGFGLLLLPLEGSAWEGLRLIVALTLISFPLLYRWIVHGALVGLQNQIQVARALGATWRMVCMEVVWPQAAPAILRASALAAVWACGDFAISGILLNSNSTLPLLISNLLDNYRFSQAALLLMPLFGISLAVYFFFARAARYVIG